jgi:hypothetical protein
MLGSAGFAISVVAQLAANEPRNLVFVTRRSGVNRDADQYPRRGSLAGNSKSRAYRARSKPPEVQT